MTGYTILWLVLFIGFLIMEASTVAVVSLWFACGALVSMIASLLGAQIWLQAVLFVGVSALLLALLRPVMKKFITPKLVATNADSLIGTTGIVIEEIDNINAKGRVKLGGMEWSARSTSGELVSVGNQVQVDRIVGVKVYVTPVKEPVCNH